MTVRQVLDRAAAFAALLAPLALRIALAIPFFRSGLTKWEAPGVLTAGARYLFAEEYRLHLFGSAVAFPAPALFAYADGLIEIALPVLLILGIATRFSALILLALTAVIQLVAPTGWETYHLPWAAMALSLIALGPGALSLDGLIARWHPEPAG